MRWLGHVERILETRIANNIKQINLTNTKKVRKIGTDVIKTDLFKKEIPDYRSTALDRNFEFNFEI